MLYALHARDQAFEQMDAAGEATDADLFRLMLGRDQDAAVDLAS